MQVADSAELFAREKYGARLRPDGVAYVEHLKGVVSRLKGLGITDPEVLAAGWLHGTINDSMSTFDEIEKRFGGRIAVLVLSLTLDKTLPRAETEKQFVRQLKDSPPESKIIKLCDVSTLLKDMKNSPLSRTRKTKQAKKESFYLSVMKGGLTEAASDYPGIHGIIAGINEIFSYFGMRPANL